MIRISACVIVKDEEKNIGRWIQSVSGVADEIIVVDTGSLDATASLAGNFGAKVFVFPWKNDFSAAKNFALEKSSGDWIIFLDADEFFPEDIKSEIRPYLEQIHSNSTIYGLMSPLYNIDEDEGNRVISRMQQMRIFRKDEDLRYEGRVHEAIVDLSNHAAERCVQQSDFVIYHIGYSSHLVKAKAQRNLMLIKEEAAQRENPVPLYPYFVDCYAALKEYERVEYYAGKALQSTCDLPRQRVKLYRRLYDAMFFLQRSERELEKLLENALMEFPDYPDFLCQKGFLLFQQGRDQEAEDLLKKTLQVMEGQDDGQQEESAMAYAMPRVFITLGEIAEQRGEREAAAGYAKQALEFHCYEEDPVLLLCRVLDSPLDQIAVLQQYFSQERKPDRDFLQKTLSQRPITETYLYFVRPEAGTYAAFMAVGDYKAAAARAVAILREAERSQLDGVRLQVLERNLIFACMFLSEKDCETLLSKGTLELSHEEKIIRILNACRQKDVTLLSEDEDFWKEYCR